MPDDAPKYCAAPRHIQIKCDPGQERVKVYLYRLHV